MPKPTTKQTIQELSLFALAAIFIAIQSYYLLKLDATSAHTHALSESGFGVPTIRLIVVIIYSFISFRVFVKCLSRLTIFLLGVEPLSGWGWAVRRITLYWSLYIFLLCSQLRNPNASNMLYLTPGSPSALPCNTLPFSTDSCSGNNLTVTSLEGDLVDIVEDFHVLESFLISTVAFSILASIVIYRFSRNNVKPRAFGNGGFPQLQLQNPTPATPAFTLVTTSSEAQHAEATQPQLVSIWFSFEFECSECAAREMGIAGHPAARPRLRWGANGH